MDKKTGESDDTPSTDSTPPRRVACITGMHRSGTSLVASWLVRCGLTLDDGEVYGAAVGNPRGHFEDKHFVDLQAAQVSRRSPRSRNWIYTNPGTLRTDRQFEHAARGLVASRDAKYTLWGWKDPRTVLFLPSWRALIPDLRVLLLWRPCSAVASSLVARAKRSERPDMQIGSFRAVQTWYSYNERVLTYRNKYPDETLLLRIHTILQDDLRAFERIRDHLGLALDYKALAQVYEASLLKERPGSRVQRVAETLLDVRALEDALERASDRV